MQVLVWSDYLCPWCYLGLDRARHLEEGHGATVTWLPYDLHPEIPDGGVDRDPDRYAERLAPVRRLCEEAGLAFNPPTHVPRTRRALEAAEWARHSHAEQFAALHRSLFDAHWVDGRNLEDVEVLRDLAAGAGIDPDDLEASLLLRAAKDNVDESTERGRELAITGTPAWLIDGNVVVPGAQPRDVFDRVIARMHEKRQARGEDASG